MMCRARGHALLRAAQGLRLQAHAALRVPLELLRGLVELRHQRLHLLAGSAGR